MCMRVLCYVTVEVLMACVGERRSMYVMIWHVYDNVCDLTWIVMHAMVTFLSPTLLLKTSVLC